MKRILIDAARGFLAGLAVALALGALYGAVFGVQLRLDDGRPYHRHTGADGAYAGALAGLVLGGLPAGLLGAAGGVLAGRGRQRSRSDEA